MSCQAAPLNTGPPQPPQSKGVLHFLVGMVCFPHVVNLDLPFHKRIVSMTTVPHQTAPTLAASEQNSIPSPSESSAVYRGQPEDILVVSRAILAEHDLLKQGFTQTSCGKNVTAVEQLIRAHGTFGQRARMEEDETYKQIIPYFVFTHNDELFLMQRSGSANESRLSSKYTLGIGGHVRNEDLEGTIAQWGKREFHEEVNYAGAVSITPLGILNDDSNAVGRVHLGVVYLLHGDTGDISIRSELQNGRMASLTDCTAVYDRMERWSQLVFDTLKQARYL
jgi:predicted NUDIX family phosphoesterase